MGILCVSPLDGWCSRDDCNVHSSQAQPTTIGSHSALGSGKEIKNIDCFHHLSRRFNLLKLHFRIFHEGRPCGAAKAVQFEHQTAPIPARLAASASSQEIFDLFSSKSRFRIFFDLADGCWSEFIIKFRIYVCYSAAARYVPKKPPKTHSEDKCLGERENVIM